MSSLYCWLTWKTWSVGTRGTSLNIETPGILHFCSTTDETKIDVKSITLRILSDYFRCEIDVVNDVKIYTRAGKRKKCWVHVLFWNNSVIFFWITEWDYLDKLLKRHQRNRSVGFSWKMTWNITSRRVHTSKLATYSFDFRLFPLIIDLNLTCNILKQLPNIRPP